MAGALVIDVATWGSRALTGASSARPGDRFGFSVVLPGEAGRAYVAGAAFGTTVGIATPAGRIPLDPDSLFIQSQTNPWLFSGFSGVLNAAGSAQLSVNLPRLATPRGVRFFVAVVTLGPNAIRRISEPLGVTVG